MENSKFIFMISARGNRVRFPRFKFIRYHTTALAMTLNQNHNCQEISFAGNARAYRRTSGGASPLIDPSRRD